MAYLINEECVNCGACIAACPVDAITEGESIHVIDAQSMQISASTVALVLQFVQLQLQTQLNNLD